MFRFLPFFAALLIAEQAQAFPPYGSSAPGLSATGNASNTTVTATGGTQALTEAARNGYLLNIRDQGAVSDATQSTLAVSITSGSAALAVSAPTFASTDCTGGTGCTGTVNRWVVVPGAFTTAGAGVVTTIPVSAQGAGYTSVPTCAITDTTAGAGATCGVAMALQSATLVSGGSGCTNGASLTFLVGAFGAVNNYGTVARVTGTVSGGALTGTLTVSAPGFVTTLPSTLSGASIVGAGCTTNPTVNLSYGVGVAQVTAFGATYTPSTTTAALTGGAPGTAATLGTPVVAVSSLPLAAQITSFTDSQHVGLAAQATNTLNAVTETILEATGNKAAIQAAATVAQGLGYDLFIPSGNFFVEGTVDPGVGNLTIRGNGMETAVLIYYGGTSGSQDSGAWYPLFKNTTGTSGTYKGTLQFEDFQIRGLLDYGLTNIGAAALELNNYLEINENRMKFYENSWMAQQNESAYRFIVTNSTFDTVMRDQARCRSCFNDIIDHNHFIHSADDSVALHTVSYIQGQGLIRDSITVTNNDFEDTACIHILGGRIVTVTGNTGKRCKSQGINIAPDSTEGVNPLYSVNVSDNNFTDNLSGAPFIQNDVVFDVNFQQPATETVEPNFIPGISYRYTNYVAPTWEYSNVNYTTGLEPVPPGFGLHVANNNYARTLNDTANYSGWNFGKTLTSYGFLDLPVFGASLSPTSILSVPANSLGAIITGNSFANARRCVSFSGPAFPSVANVTSSNNLCYDTWEYGYLSLSSGTIYLTTTNDRFILDPNRLSGGRTGTHGAWSNTTTTSRVFSLAGTPYIIACGDTFAEAYSSNITGNAVNDGCMNYQFGDPQSTTGYSSANYGMAVYNQPDGHLWSIVSVNSDPSNGTPAQYYGLNYTHLTVSATMPTSGFYAPGDVVWASGTGKVACGCLGWTSMTLNTAGRTLGVDWTTIPLANFGTTFTLSGSCSTGTLSGDATGGTFVSSTTGTCTTTITPNGATGLAAAHKWICLADDWTTPADLIAQNAGTTTTATISGTTVSGDTIGFACSPH